jgi:hypothetical protein
MFFKKKTAADAPSESLTPAISVDDIPESQRVRHGQFTVIPVTKQLHNGSWIASIVLEKATEEGPRRYDFFGPMTEYPSEEDARVAGVEHAVRRLDARVGP